VKDRENQHNKAARRQKHNLQNPLYEYIHLSWRLRTSSFNTAISFSYTSILDVIISAGWEVSESVSQFVFEYFWWLMISFFLTRLEGPVEPYELIARLQTIIANNEVALVAARAER
jgi:hypothetical protein